MPSSDKQPGRSSRATVAVIALAVSLASPVPAHTAPPTGPGEAGPPLTARPRPEPAGAKARVDLELDGEPVASALYRTAAAGSLDMVCAGDARGRVTGRFTGRPAREVVETIVRTAGLHLIDLWGILLVTAHPVAAPGTAPPAAAGPNLTVMVKNARISRLLAALGADVPVDHVVLATADPTVTAHLQARAPGQALAVLALATGMTLAGDPADGKPLLLPAGRTR
jgi:hypothetical protein